MTGGQASEIDTAASMALLGLPALVYLRSRDDELRLALGVVHTRAIELLDKVQRNQAIHIANALSGRR